MNKRFLTLMALVAGSVIAATSYTTHYNLGKPGDGDINWGSTLRGNMDTIDTQLNANAVGLNDHITDTAGAHAATAISTTPGTTCSSATTVQAFVTCLDVNFSSLIGGEVVTTNTTQTITGAKTFTALQTFDSGLTLSGGSLTLPFTEGVLKSDGSGLVTSSKILNADIDASAAIEDSKLATIATALKVSNSATTATSANTASAIVARDGSGNFVAGDVTLTTLIVPTVKASSSAGIAFQASGGTAVFEIGAGGGNNVTFEGNVLHKGTMILRETGGGTDAVTFTGPASTTGYTITMPGSAPTANTSLSYNGTDYVWSSALVNPMDSAGDMIYGGASGVATKLDSGTSGQVLRSAGSSAPTWGTDVLGVSTNSNAAAGEKGEYIESVIGITSFSPSTTGQFKDITSITLGAGDWDLTGVFYFDKNGGVVTNVEILVGGTASGNNSTGGVVGSNYINAGMGSGDGSGASIPNYRVSIASSTTYYMKVKFNFTVATPNYAGRLSARRVR